MASCGFVDLRPIKFSIEPDITNSVLPDSFSPVIIRFETEMIKKETEGIVQISSDTGSMRGDFTWDGNTLYFVPVPGWTAGTRYTLSLLGTMQSVDGRDLRVERFVSFFAINMNTPPVLEWSSPAAGESVGTNDFVIEFYFSRSMDRSSVETALSVEGIGNKNFEWSDEDKLIKFIADKPLSPWTSYKWNLRESAKCINGVPLAKTYSGHFTTDLDQTLPQIVSVYPVLNQNGSWYPTGLSVETGLGISQGIAVVFNKTMGENVLRSLRFEPALTGRTEMLNENSIVYIFTRDPEPETVYTLIVSADTRDSEGLKIGEEYRVSFIPDSPVLNVLSFHAEGSLEEIISGTNNVLEVYPDPATGDLFFTIHFSLPFNNTEKQNMAQKIMLSAFFPRTLVPVALQYVSWIGDDRLYMCWEGLTPGSEEPHFYKLVIPGGKGGISSGTGIFMKEDIVIYLEAK
jgi:hypothetical protein